MVAADAERGDADQCRHDGCHDPCQRDGEPEPYAEITCENCGRIGANSHQCGMAHREYAGLAEEHGQTVKRDNIDAGGDGQRDKAVARRQKRHKGQEHQQNEDWQQRSE